MPRATSTTKPFAGVRSSTNSRLSELSNRSEQAQKAEREYAAKIVPYLADRAYHLPGNNWMQDWVQYFTNNHPIFGICCHHSLHPVGTAKRIFILIGSIAFGLLLTNLIILWFLYYTDDAYDEELFAISVSTNLTLSSSAGNATIDEVSVTNGQIFLWTVGGALHSLFDLGIWYIGACACFQPGGCMENLGWGRFLGSYIVIFTTIIVTALATFIVILRATIDSADTVNLDNVDSGGLVDDEIHLGEVDGVRSFRFLISWLIEVVVAHLVWNPILGTILFSGILGCCRLPVLGGRPREVRLELRHSRIKHSATTDTDTYP